VIQASGEDDFSYADWTAPCRTPAGRDEVLAAHGGSFDLLRERLNGMTANLCSGHNPSAL